MKYPILLIGLLFVGLGLGWVKVQQRSVMAHLVAVTTPVASADLPSSAAPVTATSTLSPIPLPSTPPVLPATVNLVVPFLVQAPHAHWDKLHEDTCEEASLVMVKHFYQHTPIVSDDAGDQEMQALVSYEDGHGYGPSITVQQLGDVAQQFPELAHPQVKTEVSVEALEAELAAGRPVIVPAAGQELPNPYFTPPGPVYHMVVVKGYDQEGFITNDPGVKQGADFRYTFTALDKAIHDYDPNGIDNGRRAYLTFL